MCSVVYNDWYTIYQFFNINYDDQLDLSPYVDTVGGSGGASNCVVNSTNPSGTSFGTCASGSTTTGSSYGNITLINDGWPSPAWQTGSGVTGTGSLTTRAIPDVSFFSGNGNFDSATLICVSILGSCTLSTSTENTAQEVGGTSVATPQMAGVMALINQKAGAAQGLANPQLYQIASHQTYSSCSAESVSNSSSCYFQDIDNGPAAASGSPSYTTAQTNSMPCALSADTLEGGDVTGEGGYTAAASPNCFALNSGDTIGTLATSTSAGSQTYNSTIGFDLATGLGSLNVANVLSAWVSDAGTDSSTMTVTPVPSTITINQALTVTVSVTGSSGTPTGTITLTGDGYSNTETIGTSPCTSNTDCVFNISANTLAAGSSITLTAYYNGNATYAANSKTTTITVNVMTPTVTFPGAPTSGNVANAINFTVAVSGPSGSTAIPSGTVYLKSGTYETSTSSLTSGSTTITFPAGSLAVGLDTITAYYNGDANYAGSDTGTTQITMSQTTALTPSIMVNPSSASIDTGQSLGVTVLVTGTGPTPTGQVYLTSGSYTSSTETIGTSPCTSNTSCGFTIPDNTLSTGTDSITAHYLGDTNYAAGTGSGNVSVTESTLPSSPLTPGTPSPSTVTPPGTATVAITGNASTTYYTGTITFGSSSCALTTPPSGANTSVLPTCTGSGTITYTNGTPSGSGTATVTTYSVTTGAMIRPKFGNGKGWLGAGSGAVLALVIFFGIPKRRRSWRAMLPLLLVMVALGALASCGGGGGGGGGGGTTTTSTTPGSYTFTITGTASPTVPTVPSTTFTITVN